MWAKREVWDLKAWGRGGHKTKENEKRRGGRRNRLKNGSKDACVW